MRTPGFTAHSSLYKSRRQYRTGQPVGALRGYSTVTPQQDRAAAAGPTCCGTNCPGACICKFGHGVCIGAADNDGTATPLRVQMATESVTMAIDSCHASSPIVSSDGTISYAIAFCPGGCWASSHDAGCLPSTAAADAGSDPVVLKG